MADVDNDIRRSSTFGLDDVLKCADLLAKYAAQVPDTEVQDEPPAYDECVADCDKTLQREQTVSNPLYTQFYALPIRDIFIYFD